MRLVLTLRAEADIEDIAAFIFELNPQGARRVEAALKAAFELIKAYPLAGNEIRRGIRRLTVPRYPYLIFYGVDEIAGEIRVFTVRHAARRDEA